MKEFCVDLEIAKELKENGFLQATIQIWYKYGNPLSDGYTNEITSRIWANNYEVRKNNIICSAPCSDEILKELPHEINGFWLVITPVSKGYEVGYWEPSNCEDEKRFEHYFDEKLSNALSNLWLYLKKEGYIK